MARIILHFGVFELPPRALREAGFSVEEIERCAGEAFKSAALIRSAQRQFAEGVAA